MKRAFFDRRLGEPKNPHHWRLRLVALATVATLVACGGGGGGSDEGGSASLDGGGAAARDVPVASSDMTALLNAYAYHLAQRTPVVVGGATAGALVAEQAESAGASSGATVDSDDLEELVPAARSAPATLARAARPCPAGGTVDTTDLGVVVGVRFSSCAIPVGGVINTYNGTASVDVAPGNVRADTDVELRTTGGGRNDVIRVFFENLSVQSRGGACNETVTMEVGRLSGNSAVGAYSIEWRNVTSERRPAGRDCTWNVALRVFSDGIFTTDAAAPPVPAVRQSLDIRTLEPLRYSPDGVVGALNLPYAGRVQLRNLESGAQTTLRIADGGVYVSSGGAETFLSNAELLARVRGG